MRCNSSAVRYFNSRPHEEVDQGQVLKWALDFVFQLTTSQGGRHSANIHLAPHFLFQLTTSQGGRRFLSGVKTKRKMYFNSRPRKEVDQRQLRIGLNDQIISTHDLARRSTPPDGKFTKKELFQLTTSQGGRPLYLDVLA